MDRDLQRFKEANDFVTQWMQKNVRIVFIQISPVIFFFLV